MSSDTTQLASLIASRLCHDLLSPVGGMTNGVELLADETDPAMRDQCIELLAMGARRTATKLRFFRLAFGAAGGFDALLPAAELHDLVGALAAEAREVNVQWAVVPDALSKAAAKVLLNFSLLGIEGLPRGGTLSVAVEETAAGFEIAIRAEGPRIAFDADVGRAIEGELGMDALSAHTAPAELVRRIAAECGGRVQHAATAEALVFGAELPRG